MACVHSTPQSGFAQETRTPAPSWTESKRWADGHFSQASRAKPPRKTLRRIAAASEGLIM